MTTITTSDGVALAATLFEPESSNGQFILINSAMGVRQRYYRRYASFLAEHGYTVLTYDYRGIGESVRGDVKHDGAKLEEWGIDDFAAALDWVTANFPQLKLLVLGHSVGGQILGLAANNQQIKGVLMVACQSGYWRGWSGNWKIRMFFLWYAFIPILCRVFGYFPASKFGIGEDVPTGIALHWARAGRRRMYLLDVHRGTANDHYEKLTAPIISLSIEDDTYAPRRTVEALLPFYPNSKRTHHHLVPAEFKLKKIGHFGFFRQDYQDSLWEKSLVWLGEL